MDVASSGPGLIMGYDWERYGKHTDEAQNKVERGWSETGVKAILDVHRRHGAPLTFFVLTKILDVPSLASLVKQAAGEKLVEIAQHSHSHKLFRRLASSDEDPISLKAYLADVRVAQEELLSATDREPCGFRAPLGYYEGLRGFPEIVNGLYAIGLRYVSSDARNARDEFPAPWRNAAGEYRQPYFYDSRPLLEIPIQGWSDNVLKGMSKRTPLPDAGLDAEVQHHREHLDFAERHRLLYAPAYHPWSIGAKDPTASVVDWLLGECRGRQIPIWSYDAVWRAMA